MLGAADPTRGMSLSEFGRYHETYRAGRSAADLAEVSRWGRGRPGVGLDAAPRDNGDRCRRGKQRCPTAGVHGVRQATTLNIDPVPIVP